MENQNVHNLRLCHIHKWDHFEGYGFNLHAEKGKPGQYIGKVDDNSPADAAGLKEGDRIIEVNGVNISLDNHKQVVQRIKTLKNETKLLVVDAESDAYFKAQNIHLHGGLSCIIHLTTPPASDYMKNNTKTDTNNDNDKQNDKTSNTDMAEIETKQTDSPMISQSNENGSGKHDEKMMQNDEKSSANSLRLNMTAKELRAQLAARRRYDPKNDSSIDLRKKYDIVQKL
ncbi:hypothetical protein O3M35_004666 [Rhynocoris fuscipes]|uniref:PDZ domain-containing protein n=1 Tax=Rhynocoris fuscipes TaxID=488301 RepID=A0AAW1CGC1_9HEMI